MFNRNKILAMVVIALSAALWFPGVTQPMMTIKADLHRQILISEGKKIVREQPLPSGMMTMAMQFLDSVKVSGSSRVYTRTQSVTGLVQELWKPGYRLVSILVVCFSVVVPALKTLLMGLALFMTDSARTHRLMQLNSVISKWAMGDVFTVGVLTALLAISSGPGSSAALMLDMELLGGFYWFLAYCLFS
ncbi:MAG: paraquat-inducible protein A, partial [Desulfovibrionales bacterium]|nr:paraquat-inducible protein A [Desulfovibrionales bacterium]